MVKLSARVKVNAVKAVCLPQKGTGHEQEEKRVNSTRAAKEGRRGRGCRRGRPADSATHGRPGGSGSCRHNAAQVQGVDFTRQRSR